MQVRVWHAMTNNRHGRLKGVASRLWNTKTLVRLAFSGLVMGFLFSKVPVKEVTAGWQTTNWPLLIVTVLAIHSVTVLLRALRLRVILGSQGIEAPLWWLSFIQLRGIFLKSFLPGGIASDAYRTYAIAQKTEKKYRSLLSILSERVLGLISVMALSCIGLLYGTYRLKDPAFTKVGPPVLSLSLILFCAGLLAFAVIRAGLLTRLHLSFGFWPRMQRILEEASSLFANNTLLAKIATLSMALQVSIVLWYYAVARAQGLDLSLFILFMVIPVVEFLVTLPISIAGIGVREGALIFMLAPFGVRAADALSYSVLSFVIISLASLLSGITFMFDLGEKWDHADLKDQTTLNA